MATAPSITSNGGGDSAIIAVPENTLAIGRVTATDPDPGTTLTYSIIGGADRSRLVINPSTGELSFSSSIYTNFEFPNDVDNNGSYVVQVDVSDGALSDTQTITVNLTNVDEVPRITSNGGQDIASIPVFEGSTSVTRVSATDPDADTTLTYSVIGGADADRFQLNAATGLLEFKTAPDFELPTDADHNNGYVIQVLVSDGQFFDTQTITANIDNVNEAPTITSNGGGSSSQIAVPENSTAVTTVTAIDPDANASLTYTIAGGADAARFRIDAASGALSFIAAPDFEAPTDSGGNNSYDVEVRVSDGSFSDSQLITVNVINVNEFAPVITSDGGGDLASLTRAENTTAVTTVTSTDGDGTPRTYAIVGGADAGKFQINAISGAISFLAAPNFEAPADSDRNNSYVVQVGASDGSLLDAQTITVNITNVAEPFTGGFRTGAANYGAQGLHWQVQGTGDLNGDGTADILWRDTSTGELTAWFMQNGQHVGAASYGIHGLQWRVQGIGDLNGDGTADILWRDTSTGEVTAWFMQNGAHVDGASYGIHGPQWQVQASGDLTGDGTSDILWRDTSTGQATAWLMTGGAHGADRNYGIHGLQWQVQDVGDLNGDGMADIFWRSIANGQATAWMMQDAVRSGDRDYGIHSLSWQEQALGDFNNDGSADVLWRNLASGEATSWLLSPA
jgi:hypothetical protein